MIDDPNFSDFAKFIEEITDRASYAHPMEFSLEQAAQKESEHTGEDMDLNFLIGPVVLRTKRDVMGIFHATEGCLYVMLASVSTHNLSICPVLIVSKEDSLAKDWATNRFSL